MPNWTSNTIRIEGTEADLRAFLEAVKWQDEIFDFNRIIPMPELLKHTGSGHQTIDGKAVREWYVIGNEIPSLPNDKSVRLFTPAEEKPEVVRDVPEAIVCLHLGERRRMRALLHRTRCRHRR